MEWLFSLSSRHLVVLLSVPLLLACVCANDATEEVIQFVCPRFCWIQFRSIIGSFMPLRWPRLSRAAAGGSLHLCPRLRPGSSSVLSLRRGGLNLLGSGPGPIIGPVSSLVAISQRIPTVGIFCIPSRRSSQRDGVPAHFKNRGGVRCYDDENRVVGHYRC
jgi:hypothetical protein